MRRCHRPGACTASFGIPDGTRPPARSRSFAALRRDAVGERLVAAGAEGPVEAGIYQLQATVDRGDID